MIAQLVLLFVLLFTLAGAASGRSKAIGGHLWIPVILGGGGQPEEEEPMPGDFGKISPFDGEMNVLTSVTLSWSASADAESYSYYCKLSEGEIIWIDVGSNTSVLIEGLNYSTTYFWQVQAVNANGETYADADTAWHFHVRSESPDD